MVEVELSPLIGSLLVDAHIVEVEVGTEAEQHDGGQHVVDQVPELWLQVALPVPEDQHQGGSAGQQDAHGKENIKRARRQ